MRKIILAVDHDQKALQSLGQAFRHKSYDFIPFDSTILALLALRHVKPHVIISDSRMPHIKGVDFLSRARTITQKSFRILLTVPGKRQNPGEHVDRIMQKPCSGGELEHEVAKTTVHSDRIIVPIVDSPKKNAHKACGLCGSDTVTHEVRYENFTECLCTDCRTKLHSFAGSYLEPMILRQMFGNVL